MESYDNLVEGISDLRAQGYVEDFNIEETTIACRAGAYQLRPDDFEIDKWFRIEGDDSSAENSSILYAISSEKYGLKGTMVNAYGVYSDSIADDLLAKLNFA